MNIVTLLGGPRTDGNTDRLLDWAERALRDWRHEVTRINLAELTINGCKSLVACAGPEDGNADLIQTSFERLARYLKLDNRGAFVFPHCTDVNMLPNTHGGKARELAQALTE